MRKVPSSCKLRVRKKRCHLSSPVSQAWILIQHIYKWVTEAFAERKLLVASGRYDQSTAYAPQRGKQDGAEDQSELTLWFMKTELLMLTGFLKIIVVVNIHVRRETCDKTEPQHRDQLPLHSGKWLTCSKGWDEEEKEKNGGSLRRIIVYSHVLPVHCTVQSIRIDFVCCPESSLCFIATAGELIGKRGPHWGQTNTHQYISLSALVPSLAS